MKGFKAIFVGVFFPIVTYCSQVGADKAVDFSKIEFYPNNEITTESARKFAKNAFNNAPEIASYIAFLKEKYTIDIAVETGTFLGGTTQCFANLFREVHTIEISEQYMKRAQARLKGLQNIHFHLGSSDLVLQRILPDMIQEFLLFFLDAHWLDYWPLREEVKAISKTHKNKCIIVIDDCKVPNRADIPFDTYKKEELSLEYVQDLLNEVFTNYEVTYVIPKHSHCRAKLVVTPI